MEPDQSLIPPKQQDNKKAVIIIIAVIVVISLSVGIAWLLKNTTTPSAPDPSTTSQQAQSEYDKAQDALKNGDLETAEDALIKARNLFDQAKDTSRKKDIDAQILSIETLKPKTTPGQAPPAVQRQQN